MEGRIGDDFLAGNRGDDSLYGGAGNDELQGHAGMDRLLGNGGDDTLYGGRDSDLLDGGNDDDELFGQLGPDQLQGGYGNDVLVGGGAVDTMNGGEGSDECTVGVESRNNCETGVLGDDHAEVCAFVFAADSPTNSMFNGANGTAGANTLRLTGFPIVIFGTPNAGDFFYYFGIANGQATPLGEDQGDLLISLGGTVGAESFACSR